MYPTTKKPRRRTTRMSRRSKHLDEARLTSTQPPLPVRRAASVRQRGGPRRPAASVPAAHGPSQPRRRTARTGHDQVRSRAPWATRRAATSRLDRSVDLVLRERPLGRPEDEPPGQALLAGQRAGRRGRRRTAPRRRSCAPAAARIVAATASAATASATTTARSRSTPGKRGDRDDPDGRSRAGLEARDRRARRRGRARTAGPMPRAPPGGAPRPGPASDPGTTARAARPGWSGYAVGGAARTPAPAAPRTRAEQLDEPLRVVEVATPAPGGSRPPRSTSPASRKPRRHHSAGRAGRRPPRSPCRPRRSRRPRRPWRSFEARTSSRLPTRPARRTACARDSGLRTTTGRPTVRLAARHAVGRVDRPAEQRAVVAAGRAPASRPPSGPRPRARPGRRRARSSGDRPEAAASPCPGVLAGTAS